MCSICPTVTATNKDDYSREMDRVSGFSTRLHIDLMDKEFTGVESVSLMQAWWPEDKQIDLHIMYKRPEVHLETLVALKPDLVIIHAEAECNFIKFCDELHAFGIKTGVALLQETPVESMADILEYFDHALIFSGKLGHHGGRTDLGLLDKVAAVKAIQPDIEVSWDGGINNEVAAPLCRGGVDVLNIGGYIQHADNPEENYNILLAEVAE